MVAITKKITSSQLRLRAHALMVVLALMPAVAFGTDLLPAGSPEAGSRAVYFGDELVPTRLLFAAADSTDAADATGGAADSPDAADATGGAADTTDAAADTTDAAADTTDAATDSTDAAGDAVMTPAADDGFAVEFEDGDGDVEELTVSEEDIADGIGVTNVDALANGAGLDDADADADDVAPVQTVKEVVVTGSRIKGASETGLLPVTVLGADELEAWGVESTGDILSNLAQAGSFEFNDSSDGPNDARGDIATVNLRGLGSGNTLILLNGRRNVTHPFTQDVNSTPRAVVNVNSIPSSAIARTEILKDGASSLYGADAAAGVVNLILNEDFSGTRITVSSTQYARLANGFNADSSSLKFSGGYTFNDNTHWNIFSSYYSREGISAAEKPYAASSDLRRLLPANWRDDEGQGDTNFRNTSSLSPWAQLQVGGLTDADTFTGVRVAGLTGAEGGFHIQPLTDDTEPSGELPFTRDGELVANIDNDTIPSTLDTDLRYDLNNARQLSPDIRRFNIFSTLHHDLKNGIRFFSELSWYNSSTHSQRAAQPLDVGLAFITIPAQNHWNPFGPSVLADGTDNPNRIGGPIEGSDVLITGWRPIDIGPRLINTESMTYRVLAGLQGTVGDWDWESAAFYSFAAVTDISGNRLSKTALLEQLSLSDDTALNPFGGPGFHDSTAFDPVRIETRNKANSAIGSWDFEISRPDLFFLASEQGSGVAVGIAWRNESYEDDRDPRLDGSQVYLDGLGSNRSDVAGVSPTADSVGYRNVWSAYAELLMPIVTDKPGAHRLDFQVAMRFEAFDDIDESIFKPKLALAWAPVSWLTFRGAYSQGFRAPNLVQLFRGDISRLSRDLDDFWRAQADLGDASGGLYRRTVRVSNTELKAEDTETSFVGVQFAAPFGTGGEVIFTTDLWNFDQENVISTQGGLEQLALDFHLRQQGSFNPNVVRAAPSAQDITAFVQAGFDADAAAGPVLYVRDQYINLDPRSVRGLDFALRLKIPETRAGRFSLRIEASRLLRFKQENVALQPLLGNAELVASQTDLGEELRGFNENRRRLDGRPTWRASGEVRWRRGGWGVLWSFNYVDDFFDTSAVNDVSGEFWLVRDWFTHNLYVDYRFKHRGLKRMRVRAGVTNLADQDPPLADEGRGYYSSYHNNRGRRFNLSLSMSF
ncbi:MAG: TonB-dependent receptor [Gammaproteobacteria bacterium]|nr:TonB-dependent receptor [Gammaproteobacteria bacterium]